jgi:arylsulfatase A-like enzyme
MRRGFRETYSFIGGGHNYFESSAEYPAGEYLVPMERDGKPEALKKYLTDALSDEAVAFVKRHEKDPFFLYLTYNAPHTPQQASDQYLSRFASIADPMRQKYAAMVSAVDDGVGRLLAALREARLDSDTLVFFLSDNGGPVGINGSSNAPFRGAKGQVYEGGIRTPFVMRWTGRLPAGKTDDRPVISLDIFPTAMAAAGAPLLAEGKKLDGINLLNSPPPDRRLFWRTGGGAQYAVREGRYKLVKIGEQPGQLYDLAADIGEARDIAAEKKDVFERLEAARVEWDRQLIPPRFESPRPAAKKKV